jgi:hypothetical protein
MPTTDTGLITRTKMPMVKKTNELIHQRSSFFCFTCELSNSVRRWRNLHLLSATRLHQAQVPSPYRPSWHHKEGASSKTWSQHCTDRISVA